MKTKLSDAQRRILFELVMLEDRPLSGKVKTTIRDPMVQAGLIELLPRGGKLRGKLISPTEAGWAWVIDHLDEPFTSSKVQLGRVWNQLTKQLQIYLREQDDNLTSVLHAGGEEEATLPAQQSNPQDELLRAYLHLSQGAYAHRVKLASLRAEAKLNPETFDATVRALFEQAKVVLYPEDDGRGLRPQDRAAAIDVSGVAQHIIYWER